MKTLGQRISINLNYTKLYEWGRLITITSGAQALIQASGLLSGILIIRFLSTQEYSLYTLANTMLGTIVLIADGGVGVGVMSEGGKVWQDRKQLGTVLVTGLDLRKKFAIGTLLIATPILLYLLHHHGASWLMAGLITVALFPAFITSLTGALLEIAPRLSQDIVQLQKNQLGANLGRLAVTALVLVSVPWAFVAILAAGLPQIWANRALRKISIAYADWNQQADVIIRQKILVFVKRIMPGAIYYCLSGQITIWLISIFGTTSAVAQVGALGRITMALSLFGVLFSTLIVPRFARLPSVSKLLLNRYLQIQAVLFFLYGIMIILAWLFSNQILWVLGKNYINLNTELVLSIINGCLALLVAASYSICNSRGWVIHPAISIIVTLGALISGIVLFNIGSLMGILSMNILISSIELIMYLTYGMLKIRNMDNIIASSNA